MNKLTGIKVNGAFFNEDGTNLTWQEFVDKIESVGLSYGGLSLPIDDEGKTVEDRVFRKAGVSLPKIAESNHRKKLRKENKRIIDSIKYNK